MLRSLPASSEPVAALPVASPWERRRPVRQVRGPAPLALSGVTKRWRRGQAPVLDDVTLTLEPGTSSWIGGRNGVGKTTLLRIAAGLIYPELGAVEVRGTTVQQDRVGYQRRVSFLPAGDRGLYARLTVRRHLEFWARIAMVPGEQLSRAVTEASERFELVELSERRVDRISMGQRQRLRIAMTFLPKPDVLLLDEPLTSLDEEGVELLRRASTELRERGGAILWCSPNVDHDQGSFDARWSLQDGRLLAI